MIPENDVVYAKIVLNKITHLNTGEDFCRTSRLAILRKSLQLILWDLFLLAGNIILAVSDYFTWWVEGCGIPNQETIAVAKLLADNTFFYLFCHFLISCQFHLNQGWQRS